MKLYYLTELRTRWQEVSLDADARVNQGVGYICQRIEDHNGCAGEYDCRLQDGIVALANSGERDLTDTWNVEELFSNKDARDQKAQRWPDDGDERNAGIAQGMAVNNTPLAQTL